MRIELGSLPAQFVAALEVETVPHYSSPYVDVKGRPQLEVRLLQDAGNSIAMCYSDGTTFILDAEGTRIWGTTPPDQTVEDTATYLLGPIMGTVLRIRGIVCLHGSVVVVDGRGVGMVGVSGSGKSTTAAAFARLGFSVLTDDLLALKDKVNHFVALPAYPRVRLWPSSVAGLWGAEDALPRLTPTWNKRYLGLNESGRRFQSEPLEISAMYFLERRVRQDVQPPIQPIKSAEALLRLIGDSYAANYVPNSVRAAEFEVLSRLVQHVPLRRATAIDDFSRVDEFCEAIVDDCRAITTTAVAGLA